MPEIFRISDSYTVLRNGEFIQSGKISETNAQEITSTMVGSSFSTGEIYAPRALGEDVLSFEQVSGPGFTDVSLRVQKGEILGLTGLQGSGASEFLQMILVSSRSSLELCV